MSASAEIVTELKKVLSESSILSDVKAFNIGYRQRGFTLPEIQIDIASRSEENYSTAKEKVVLETRVLGLMKSDSEGVKSLLNFEDNIIKALLENSPVILNGKASEIALGSVEYGFSADNANIRVVTIPVLITYFIFSKTRLME